MLRRKTLAILALMTGCFALVLYGVTTVWMHSSAPSGKFLATAAWTGTTIFFGGLGFLLVDRQVVSRVVRLGKDLRHLREQGAASARLPVSGSDEISRVADDVNHLLAGLERSEMVLHAFERRSILQVIPDQMVVVDREGVCLEYKGEKTDFLAFEPQDIVGKVIHDTGLFQDVSEPAFALGQQALASRRVMSFEYDLYSPTKGDCRCEVRVAVLSDNEILYILRDVTDRKRSDAQIRYQANLLSNVNDAIVAADKNFRLQVWNPAAEKLYGWKTGEVIGKPVAEVLAGEHDGLTRAEILRKLVEEGQFEGEVVYQRKDGETLYVEEHSIELYDETGQISGYVSVNRDITQRKQAELALEDANQQLTQWVKTLEENNREMALLIELNNAFQHCFTSEDAHATIAQYVEKLFASEAGGVFIYKDRTRTLETLVVWGGYSPQHKRTFQSEECLAIRRGRPHLVESRSSEKSCSHLESTFSTSTLCVPMMANNEIVGLLNLQIKSGQEEYGGLSFNASRQRLAIIVAERLAGALLSLRLQETLRSHAIRDPLTNLFNRRYLEETLARELWRAERAHRSLCVFQVEIDHLKQISESMGPEASELVLREVGGYLQSHIRGGDIACRYGSDVFTLILPEAQLEASVTRADQLRMGVRGMQLSYLGQSIWPVSVSIGVAGYPQHGANVETLIRSASAALFKAKVEGSDRVVSC